MDPSQRQQRLADLSQKLAALTTEVVNTEDELTTLEADGQLTLGATPASAVQIPRTPAEKVSLFLDLFGSLPTPVLAALRRLATFPNPVFHEKLRLRFATFDTPRFLFAGEWHADRLVLPRGVLDQSLSLLETAGATVAVQDAREAGTRVPWKFQGELREGQEKAVRKMRAEDNGVLCAPPGAGKTLMAREERITMEIVVDCYNESEAWSGWSRGWWCCLDGKLAAVKDKSRPGVPVGLI